MIDDSKRTRKIRYLLNELDIMVWQTRYHDHIIRNESKSHHIQEYVLYNPKRWQEEMFF